MDETTLQSALEGILFTAGEPMETARLREVLSVSEAELDRAANALEQFYRQQQRGIRLVRLDDALQLVSAPEHVDLIRQAMERRKPPKLSASLLEVLAIVAYFQPTTRGYIEQVRGVSSGHSVSALVDRGLIEECGRLNAPGRPVLFRTTKHFLQTFALQSLEDLPPLPELSTEGEKPKEPDKSNQPDKPEPPTEGEKPS